MNNVKKYFHIRDLENLSGIKAHTIRIWEKRYDLLSPERTETNIRSYSIASLQKLLNIALLNKNGYKISKIAKIPEEQIPLVVKEIVASNSTKSHAINAFKMAMMNFDQGLFQSTYNTLLVDRSFREIFWNVFIPLFDELGLLWQTSTISPAHEHFISNLIKQKIYLSTEKLQALEPIKKDKIFVLYLPENEIHEIGLLFINYELVLRGYKTIYLGQTMPLENLSDLQKFYDDLHYISYLTVSPSQEKINNYIKQFGKTLDTNSSSRLWILGRQAKSLSGSKLPKFVRIFESIQELVEVV